MPPSPAWRDLPVGSNVLPVVDALLQADMYRMTTYLWQLSSDLSDSISTTASKQSTYWHSESESCNSHSWMVAEQSVLARAYNTFVGWQGSAAMSADPQAGTFQMLRSLLQMCRLAERAGHKVSGRLCDPEKIFARDATFLRYASHMRPGATPPICYLAKQSPGTARLQTAEHPGSAGTLVRPFRVRSVLVKIAHIWDGICKALLQKSLRVRKYRLFGRAMLRCIL